MMTIPNVAAIAAAGVLMTSLSASAALVDFTDDHADLSGMAISGYPDMPTTNEAGHGTIALPDGKYLVGDNDGMGIGDDELSNSGDLVEFVTIDFGRSIRLTGVYFLDLFTTADGEGSKEEALVTIGSAPGAVAASFEAAEPFVPGGVGLGGGSGLDLVGQVFTFWVADSNDAVGNPDAALAAVEVAPIPLPASALLLGAAIGGLGFMRRKTRQA